MSETLACAIPILFSPIIKKSTGANTQDESVYTLGNKCPSCGVENPTSAVACHNCGFSIADTREDKKKKDSFLVYQGWAGSTISFTYELFVLFSLALWVVIGTIILIMRTNGFSFGYAMILFAILLIIYLLWFLEGRRNAKGP